MNARIWMAAAALTVASPAAAQPAAPSTITVTAADDIAGRPVRDSVNRYIGEVAFVMLDIAGGTVPYLIVGSAGGVELGTGYVAVPWTAVKPVSFGSHAVQHPDRDTPVYLDLSLERLREAPRFAADELFGVMDRERMSRVYSWYGYAPPMGYGIYGGPYGYGPAAVPVAGDAKAGQSFVMVTPYDYTTLARGGSNTAFRVRGSQVRLPDGAEAEIDRIMIDAASGRIAYVLLEAGGFLGIGAEDIPVPPGALRWSLSEDYELVLARERLAEMPTLPEDVVPQKIDAADLRYLYDLYGVQPYWRSG